MNKELIDSIDQFEDLDEIKAIAGLWNTLQCCKSELENFDLARDIQVVEIDRLVTELERSRWQKMETAPRDGEVIDLINEHGHRDIDVWWTEDDCWSNVTDDSYWIGWSSPNRNLPQ